MQFHQRCDITSLLGKTRKTSHFKSFYFIFMMISDFFYFTFVAFMFLAFLGFSILRTTASTSKPFNRPKHDERQRETERKTVKRCKLFQR